MQPAVQRMVRYKVVCRLYLCIISGIKHVRRYFPSDKGKVHAAASSGIFPLGEVSSGFSPDEGFLRFLSFQLNVYHRTPYPVSGWGVVHDLRLLDIRHGDVLQQVRQLFTGHGGGFPVQDNRNFPGSHQGQSPVLLHHAGQACDRFIRIADGAFFSHSPHIVSQRPFFSLDERTLAMHDNPVEHGAFLFQDNRARLVFPHVEYQGPIADRRDF